MDFICSLTGKSPSTTGAGSEEAHQRAVQYAGSTTDLNNALLSYILPNTRDSLRQQVTSARINGLTMTSAS